MCGLCHSALCDGIEHAQDGTFAAAAASGPGGTTSLNYIIGQLNRGDYSWGGIAVVTYSFAKVLPSYAKGLDEYDGFNSFNSQQMDMARLALETWSDVADITFQESNSYFAPIRFANSDTLADYSAAHAYLPGFSSWAGDVWVNSDYAYNTAPEIGNYGYKVLVHEIGHAIGQPHPGDYNASGGKLSYQNNAAYAEDSAQYSIMSYWDESHTGADFGDAFAQTPMLHDILAIQAKYGVNMSTRTDDTVYGFNSNTESPIYDFSQNTAPVFSIWDAGGIDTIDFSGYFVDTVINLNEGGFSSAAGLTNNISIAYGAVIENAIGGAGDDVVIGNQWDNLVDAGAGSDVFVLNQSSSSADTYVFDNGETIVFSDHGTDRLTNVEIIFYADAELDVIAQTQVSILEYAASYEDVEEAFGTDEEALFDHFVEFGLTEGRTIDFSALDYIASHEDLIEVFGADAEAGARHYIEFGRAENREITFDSAAFLEANPELVPLQGQEINAAKMFIEL
jgi:serralysin